MSLKYQYASCTCTDLEICEKCREEAHWDDLHDKQRDDDMEREWERQNERDSEPRYEREAMSEHDPRL